MKIANPLYRHNLFQSHDLAETEAMVGQFICPHRMLAGRTQQINARVDGLSLGDLGLYYLRYGTKVNIDAGEISDYYLVQMALSGSASVVNGKRQTDAAPGFTTLVSPCGVTKIHMDQECSYLVLLLKRKAIEKQLCESLDRPLKEPVIFDLFAARQSQTTTLQQTMIYLCQQYNNHAFELNQPRINIQYNEMLISLLLNTWQHNYSEQLLNTISAPLPWHVRRAMDYIQQQISTPICLKDVAREVGVTPRTLQNGFNQFLNQTPSGYIQSLRLNLTYRALDQADPKQHSVTEILLDHGINDAGRFARRYKCRFGELPSETLRR